MSNAYHFDTHWRVLGTVEEVATILSDATELGRWWPSVYLDVRELSPGDEQGLGKEIDLYTKGWLPYTLRWRFRVLEQRWPHSMTLEASGDIVGRGVWTLRQDGPWADVCYAWDVRADKPLLRRLSFILRPLFAANHHWAMAQGEASLRLELARRRARTPEERAHLAQPPGPIPAWVGRLVTGALVALGLLVLWGALRRRQRAAPTASTGSGAGFDPDRVAHFEAAGWRAYYERDWLRLLRLLVAVSQEQFRIPFPRSLLAAYHVTRAAAAWAPKEHDQRAVRRHYERFYRLARRYSGLAFDPARVAGLELAYNDAHRRLSGRPDEEKGPFLRAMTDLHAALFGLTPAQARHSARLRVLANNVVDGITSRRSRDVAADWARLEGYLRDCYRSIRTELSRTPSPPTADRRAA